MESVKQISSILKSLAIMHLQNSFSKNRKAFNEQFETFETQVFGNSELDTLSLNVIFNFLDCWVDEVNHNFPGNHDLAKDEWPQMALELSNELLTNNKISSHLALQKFSKMKS